MMHEPTYDDDTLKVIAELQTAQLIIALLEYVKTLEKMVVKLRWQINNLTPPGQLRPYADLYSDIFEAFDDYPAFQRFKKAFEILDWE